jgi:predicted ATPase
MNHNRVFLDEIHIKDFLSLHDVKLPLKPLTILVGPNASGKSNILRALEILRDLMQRENLPSVNNVRDWLWAGGAARTSFRLAATAFGKQTSYEVELQPSSQSRIAREVLVVDGIKIISVKKGRGIVKDEDGKNSIDFRSTKLALKSAGDYGNKPVTNALTTFIREWQFYDFNPDEIRKGKIAATVMRKIGSFDIPTQLDDDGAALGFLLSDWHEKDYARFQVVNEGLKACSGLGIEQRSNGEDELYLLEGYKSPIPLERASDGTLRLLAYYILLNEPESPSLIAIEEPERNLHPAAFTAIGSLLEQLAEETQVIFTTHSSQLLDAFNPNDLSDKLGVLLLRNRAGNGTEVINLEQERNNRKALGGWIEDFGIGSAIFHSELLQDIMES